MYANIDNVCSIGCLIETLASTTPNMVILLIKIAKTIIVISISQDKEKVNVYCLNLILLLFLCNNLMFTCRMLTSTLGLTHEYTTKVNAHAPLFLRHRLCCRLISHQNIFLFKDTKCTKVCVNN